MKTKNVKVRLKDITSGRIVYTAHPVYGIMKTRLLSRPIPGSSMLSSVYFKESNCWVMSQYIFDNGFISEPSRHSLADMGITSQYNDRRTFFKLKQAEEWMNKWKTDKGFIQRHKEHEDLCRDMDNLLDLYDEYYYSEDCADEV